MQKEFKVTLLIYITTFFLALSSFIIELVKPKTQINSPLGKNFSIIAKLQSKDKNPLLVYGFLPYWTVGESKYFQLDKLTDIAYFGLVVDGRGNIVKTIAEGEAEPGYYIWKNGKQLAELIEKCKKANVRFAVTIYSHEEDKIEEFLSCEKCWNTFSNELIRELKTKGLKDVNLDFETAGETSEELAEKYTKFASFMNRKLDKEFGNSFVVVSTYADTQIKSRITNTSELAKVVDGLFIMAYDFHRPNSETAGPVAPIGGAGTLFEYDIKTMLNDYLANSPAAKLIMGVPYYGYNWVVYASEPGAERIEGNDLIGYSGSQAYADVIETILDHSPKMNWDDVGKTPYFSYISSETGSLRQVYFENADSLKIKYDLAKRFNLAGVGIWALGYDGGYQELWQALEEAVWK